MSTVPQYPRIGIFLGGAWKSKNTPIVPGQNLIELESGAGQIELEPNTGAIQLES